MSTFSDTPEPPEDNDEDIEPRDRVSLRIIKGYDAGGNEIPLEPEERKNALSFIEGHLDESQWTTVWDKTSFVLLVER